MEGHTGSCLTSTVYTDEAVVTTQDGSVLLPLLLMKSEKRKHGMQVTKSTETLFNLWHKQRVNVAERQ